MTQMTPTQMQCPRNTQSYARCSSSFITHLETAVAEVDLGDGSVNTAKGSSLAVGEVVHGVKGNVQAAGGVVDGKDVDTMTCQSVPYKIGSRAVNSRLAVVASRPASAARGAVPATDSLDTANIGEAGSLALRLPAVLGHEAVGAIRARDDGERAGAIIVAGVVGDWGVVC